jgi:hypothetical protein
LGMGPLVLEATNIARKPLFYLGDVRMEALAIVGLVGNIVQFVDFSGKLISKSTELYRSSEGALAENIDTETVTNHLVLLNSKLKDAATATGDSALENLCKSCNTAAEKLLAALDKIKVKGEQRKWKSARKALKSVWSKEEIGELERRLSKLREELNSHIIVDLRYENRLPHIRFAYIICLTESKSPSSSQNNQVALRALTWQLGKSLMLLSSNRTSLRQHMI